MKKIIAIALIVTVGSFSSLITGSAMAQVTSKLAGELSVRGVVTLNGMNATSGATVFSGSMVKTGSNSMAAVNLGKLGQVELAADSELVLKLESGVIAGELRAGRAVISAPSGIGVNIVTAEGVAVADGKGSSLLTIDVACGNTRVSSAKSDARLTAGNRVEVVSAGQEVSVGAQAGDSSRCPRLATAAAKLGGTISGGALAALILLGVGGAVAGIVAATQGDSSNPSIVSGLSSFRP